MTPADLPAPRPDWALFLDFDGTLVEIAEAPDAIRIENHLHRTIQSISERLNGALAIVSGRPVAELDQHLDHGGFAAAGLHGLEFRRRPGAPVTRPADLSLPESVLAALRDFAEANSGLLVEDKGLAVALHYRNRPDLADASLNAVSLAVHGYGNLQVLEGKMVLEVKPTVSNKGRAIQAFMSEPPFAGRIPVFAGDDVTDEDGFRAVHGLGGFGIKIGAGKTAARWRIDSVSAFLNWLESLPDRLNGYQSDPSAAQVIDR